MIDKAIDFLNQQLNTHVKGILDVPEDKVFLSNIVDQNGKTSLEPNSIGITVVNIEEETSIRDNRSLLNSESGDFGLVNPGLHLNLYLLITSNFNDYKSAMHALSLVIGFFQQTNSFKKEAFPNLAYASIDQLVVKIFKNSFELQNQLWGTIGAKLMPSILYKVGIIEFKSSQIKERISSIKTLNTDLTHR